MSNRTQQEDKCSMINKTIWQWRVKYDIKRCIQLANGLRDSHGQGSTAEVRRGCRVSGAETIQHRSRVSVSLINLFYETIKWIENDLSLRERSLDSHLCHGTWLPGPCIFVHDLWQLSDNSVRGPTVLLYSYLLMSIISQYYVGFMYLSTM